MIYLIFFLSFFFGAICFVKKNSLKANGESGGAKYAFFNSAFEVLVILALVAGFYAFLAYLVSDRGSDQITLEALRQYERGVQRVRSLLNKLKLGPFTSVLLLLTCFAISWVLKNKMNRNTEAERVDRLYDNYSGLSKWVKRVTLVVTILSSFTFFGGEVNAVNADLQVRIKTMNDNYNAVAKQLDSAVSESVAVELLSELDADQFKEQREQLKVAKTELDEVTSDYAISVAAVEEDEEEFPPIYRSPKLEGFEERQIQIEKTIKERQSLRSPRLPEQSFPTIPNESEAKQLSPTKIKKLQNDVTQYRTSTTEKWQTALERLTGEKLPEVILEDLVSHEKIISKALAENMPIIAPILKPIEDFISKLLESKINASVKSLRRKFLADKKIDVAQEIKTSAQEVVREHQMDWEPRRREIYSQFSSRAAKEVTYLRAASYEGRTKINAMERRINQRADSEEAVTIIIDDWLNRKKLPKIPHPHTETEIERIKRRIELIEKMRWAGRGVHVRRRR